MTTTLTTPTVHRSLETLLRELADGAGGEACWVLNRNDPGLLKSLDSLSADAASAVPPSGSASIAAHADHLRYGLGLMLRWVQGEDPFADADWSVSWRRIRVTSPEWDALREALGDTVHRWLDAVSHVRALSQFELTGIIASLVHLAYHLGAMRQIDRTMRGPPDPALSPAGS